MHDWNVVATTRAGQYTDARRLLAAFGRVERTHYYDVLVMRVGDIEHFLEQLWERAEAVARLFGHVVPVTHVFDFETLEEFESRARAQAAWLVPLLTGKSFHVRMHRRGLAEVLHRSAEERMLDRALLTELEARHARGAVDFTNPDAIVALETVDRRAGLSAWDRAARARFPFLGLD